MNILQGPKIGEGACSEVFEWENGHKIVKLAKPNTNRYAIERELRNNRIVWELGLPVPRPYEYVEVDGRPGAVFERIYGVSLMERMLKSLTEPAAAGGMSGVLTTARMLHEVHRYSSVELPPQRESLKYDIERVDYLTADEKSKVLAYMERLPMKHRICHGDPNPGNLILRGGETVLIDWNNATTGNPEADLAEYVLMIRYAALPAYLPSELNVRLNEVREPILKTFIEEYTRLSDITLEDIEAWILPIAARRLTIDGEEEKRLLVEEVRRRLNA
ncbi:MAG: phosphotransferase [Cohnella sp.]|nr:phosphotransferase [Cohnella sp.]